MGRTYISLIVALVLLGMLFFAFRTIPESDLPGNDEVANDRLRHGGMLQVEGPIEVLQTEHAAVGRDVMSPVELVPGDSTSCVGPEFGLKSSLARGDGVLNGRVVDAGGLAVVGIQVHVAYVEAGTRLWSTIATSDESGAFRFENVPDRARVLRVHLEEDPFSDTPDRYLEREGLRVVVGTPINIRVYAPRLISGRVVLPTGIRLPPRSTIRAHWDESMPASEGHNNWGIDADGTFAIAVPKGCSSTLFVDAHDLSAAGVTGDPVEVSVDFEGTVEIQLFDAEAVSGQIELDAPESYELSLYRLSDPISWVNRLGISISMGSSGSFEFRGVPDGVYSLVLETKGRRARAATAWPARVLAADVRPGDRLSLTPKIRPARRIEIQVAGAESNVPIILLIGADGLCLARIDGVSDSNGELVKVALVPLLMQDAAVEVSALGASGRMALAPVVGSKMVRLDLDDPRTVRPTSTQTMSARTRYLVMRTDHSIFVHVVSGGAALAAPVSVTEASLWEASPNDPRYHVKVDR